MWLKEDFLNDSVNTCLVLFSSWDTHKTHEHFPLEQCSPQKSHTPTTSSCVWNHCPRLSFILSSAVTVISLFPVVAMAALSPLLASEWLSWVCVGVGGCCLISPWLCGLASYFWYLGFIPFSPKQSLLPPRYQGNWQQCALCLPFEPLLSLGLAPVAHCSSLDIISSSLWGRRE